MVGRWQPPARLIRSNWTDEWASPEAPDPLPMPLHQVLTGPLVAAIEEHQVEGLVYGAAGQSIAWCRDNIIPHWREWQAAVKRADVPEPEFVPGLRALAKSQGLWNLALPDLADDAPGTRLSNLGYAPLAEYDVASSDATNISTSMRRDGDDYLIDGHKWFITGAAHPDCAFFIVMARTDPGAERVRQHSTIIAPTSAEGISVKRDLRYLGSRDSVAPIGEVVFKDVRVPAENLLGKEGDGFLSGQVRLGPARVHHCMRAIGNCEMLIELMMARSRERSTFGRRVLFVLATDPMRCIYARFTGWRRRQNVRWRNRRISCPLPDWQVRLSNWDLDRAGKGDYLRLADRF